MEQNNKENIYMLEVFTINYFIGIHACQIKIVIVTYFLFLKKKKNE